MLLNEINSVGNNVSEVTGRHALCHEMGTENIQVTRGAHRYSLDMAETHTYLGATCFEDMMVSVEERACTIQMWLRRDYRFSPVVHLGR